MNDFNLTEKNNQKKQIQDAKKSLNNYVNQLKFHFNLTDNDIFNITKSLLKEKKINTQKKWWHILK